MKKNKRLLALVCCMALLVGAVGATLAWLTDSTETVTNTFTAGDVEITLIETMNPDGSEEEGGVTDWAAQMIPGQVWSKNPVVSVDSETNVDCYLFVKFDENDAAKEYLTYESTLTTANGWIQGTGTIPDNVWYRIVAKDAQVKSWNLLVDDKVVVKGEDVTKDTMEEAKTAELAYTAYAVQKDNLSVEDAWKEVAVTP